MKILIILCIFPLVSLASLPEFYGASSSQSALAGQPDYNFNDPAANYYAPSILAWNKDIAYSISSYAIKTNFEEINDVVTENEVNSNETSPKKDDVDTDYQVMGMLSIHAIFPFIPMLKTKLGLSVYTPTDRLMEASSGDPYQPEYVMYRSRIMRTFTSFNFIYQYSQGLGISMGAYSGMQTNGETYIVSRYKGDENPSSGSVTINAKPTLTPQFSLTKKWSQSLSYFSFQNEMKSKLENTASGLTPVGSSSIEFDLKINTLLYYDPRIYRLGWIKKMDNHHLFTALEYQDWSGYETPKVKLERNSGIIISSDDEEEMQTQNIFIPKLAYSYNHETNTYRTGIAYRPTPLKNDLNSAGNSIDLNTTIFSLGYGRRFKVLGESFTFDTGYQLHLMESKTVNKSSGQENGDSGKKIGAPGYEVGGSIHNLTIGINWYI